MRIVTAYRPTYKGNQAGPFTVHAQHKSYLNRTNDTRSPREAMLQDLEKQLRKWFRDGESSILMMDCNESVKSPRMLRFLDRSGLRNVTLERHGQEAPPTYTNGSSVIDGIFATPSIVCRRAGFCGYDQGVQGDRSDHRCLWLDFDLAKAFGNTALPSAKPQARCLKCNDPRIVHRFN